MLFPSLHHRKEGNTLDSNPFIERPPVAGSELEPQRELNLAAVSGTSRSGNDTGRGTDVSAREDNEIGCIKVRVIHDVEDLRPELQADALVKWDVLEYGEVQAMKARSGNLCWPTAQCRNPTIDKRGSNRCLCTLRWLSEGGGVSKPAKLSLCVCVQAQIQGLTRHKEIIAASRGCGAVGATKGDWLASLKSGDPLNAPTADKLVRSARSARHEFLAFAERELIATAQVEDVADIERSQAAIVLNPDTRNVGSPIASEASAVQQIAGVR